MATYYADCTNTFVPGESNARAVGSGGVPAPTLTSINPTTDARGGGPITLHGIGTNFDGNSILTVNGVDRETAVNSSTDVSCVLNLLPTDPAGAYPVTVRTGGGTTAPKTLTVT